MILPKYYYQLLLETILCATQQFMLEIQKWTEWARESINDCILMLVTNPTDKSKEFRRREKESLNCKDLTNQVSFTHLAFHKLRADQTEQRLTSHLLPPKPFESDSQTWLNNLHSTVWAVLQSQYFCSKKR